jgi:uncharacterized protein YkwD
MDTKNWLQGAALSILTLAMTSGAAAACQAPSGAAEMRRQIVSWVNQERQARGLTALTESSALQSAATAHACDMATRGYFAHEGPRGPDLKKRLRKAGYKFSAANENIAKTFSSSVTAVNALWKKSPGHLANVLSPKVTEVGVGIVEMGGEYFWVTNSGRQAGR